MRQKPYNPERLFVMMFIGCMIGTFIGRWLGEKVWDTTHHGYMVRNAWRHRHHDDNIKIDSNVKGNTHVENR